MPDVLLGLAQQLGGDVAKALPWTTFDAMLRAAFVPLRTHGGSITAKTDDDFWQAVQTQGGWWSAPAATAGQRAPQASRLPRAAGKHAPMAPAAPEFAGSRCRFSFLFSALRLAVVWRRIARTSAVDAGAAGRADHGDVVELGRDQPQDWRSGWVSSRAIWWRLPRRQGSLRAPAVLSPGIAPDLVAMPVGQGHENFGRFASGRGANPLSILAPLTEHETGSLAWAATRVKISRVGGPGAGETRIVRGGMSGFPHEEEPR